MRTKNFIRYGIVLGAGVHGPQPNVGQNHAGCQINRLAPPTQSRLSNGQREFKTQAHAGPRGDASSSSIGRAAGAQSRESGVGA